MKSNLSKLAALFICLVITAFPISVPGAQATDVMKTKSFTGFAFEKSVVTAAMKAEIRSWVNSNATAGFVMVSCTGYTGFNANKREATFLQNLAETRSSNICNYIHSLKNVIAVNSIQGIPGDGKSATARKVTVRLIKPDDGSGSGTGGGTDGGTGQVVIGVCDNSLNVTMRSRIASSEFYFASITIKDISRTCRAKVIDVYFLDGDGNQLGVSSGNVISGTSLIVNYGAFTPVAIKSNEIKKVAFEIRAP